MTQPGFVHLNGNLLAGVDVETTGRRPGWHDIIQIAIQPLNSKCEPLEDVIPFYYTMKPAHPKRAESKASQVHKLDLDDILMNAPDRWQVGDYLDEWFTNLKLPHQKAIVPVASNWRYDSSFLMEWLGLESYNQFFFYEARDIMRLASSLNDRAYYRGHSIPFPYPSLSSLCKFFGVVNENAHDALADARAEGAVYREMIKYQEQSH